MLKVVRALRCVFFEKLQANGREEWPWSSEYMTEDILEIARRNQEKAWEMIRRIGVIEAWESVGARPCLVGSLAMGLLMKHRDIDFHIYSDRFVLEDSFAAMTRLAGKSGLRRIEYVNSLDTEEQCVEWHAWCEDDNGELWQIDMIHMPAGSPYDGYFERMAERISAVLTPESRRTILGLKYETPDEEKIPGVEYYRAVLEGGVRTFEEFRQWRRQHPLTGISSWMP